MSILDFERFAWNLAFVNTDPVHFITVDDRKISIIDFLLHWEKVDRPASSRLCEAAGMGSATISAVATQFLDEYVREFPIHRTSVERGRKRVAAERWQRERERIASDLAAKKAAKAKAAAKPADEEIDPFGDGVTPATKKKRRA